MAKICGIESSKLDEKAIAEALEAADIVPADGTPLKGKVEALVEHYRTSKPADLGDCDNCGGASDMALPRCAFCGVGAVPEERATQEFEAAEEAPEPAPEPQQDEEGDVPPDDYAGEEAAPEDEEPPVVQEEPEPAPVVAEHPTTGQPLVDQKAARAARKAAAKEAKQPRKGKAPPRQDAAGESVTAVVVPQEPAKLAGLAQLDADVIEIKRLSRGTSAGLYLLAAKIREVDESQRWKLRVDDKGTPKYRTVEDFAKEEVGFGRAYLLTLKKISVRFSQELFEAVGWSKLRLVLQAPDEHQQELLQELKQQGGALPKRDLEKKVGELRTEKGMKTSRGAASQPRKQPEKGRVTVAVAVVDQKFTIKAFKKPARKGEQTARAKRLADQPWGEHDFMNDSRIYVSATTDANGEIVFRVEIKRVEE